MIKDAIVVLPKASNPNKLPICTGLYMINEERKNVIFHKQDGARGITEGKKANGSSFPSLPLHLPSRALLGPMILELRVLILFLITLSNT